MLKLDWCKVLMRIQIFFINMLLCFMKYNNIFFNKKIVSNNVTPFRFITHATFYRKNYFRSLLFYISILLSNLISINNYNNFYVWRFVALYYTRFNPGFYSKKLVVK